MKSDEYKDWAKGNYMKTPPEVTVKYAIDTDRTGTALITSHSTYVQTENGLPSLHVRDLFTVIPTDLPVHVFDKITEWSGDVAWVGENDEATAINFKSEEVPISAVHVRGYITMSKTAMRSIVWMENFINKNLPVKLLNSEDFQLIFGDGSSKQVSGLMKNAQTYDLSGKSFAAATISAVATYNSGTQALLTFAAAHGLKNGYKITIAGATAAGYNATFDVNVASSTQILLDVTYVAESPAAWTATTKHGLKNSVDNATEIDVLLSIRGFLASSEYPVTGHIINPAMGAKIELLKNTTTDYLQNGGKVERKNGVLYVGGIRCIEINSMPFNSFLSGSFNSAAELMQFTELTLSFQIDAELARKNKVQALIAEEILFPIYNPFMFVSGNFTTAKAALET